jgi:hypothetical protein
MVGVALFRGRGRQYEALNKVSRTTGIAKMFGLSVRAWKSCLNSIIKLCRNCLFEFQCTQANFNLSAKKVRAAMATKKRWMDVSQKPPKPKVPEYLKSVIKTKANEFEDIKGNSILQP